MACIFERKTKDGETRYAALVRVKGYPRQTATFSRKTDAKLWAQQTESSIRSGKYFSQAEAMRHTFSELADRYIKTMLGSKSLKVQVQYAQQLKVWCSMIGELALAEITPALISECRDRLAKEVTSRGRVRSNASLNRYIAVLSSVMSVGVREWQWIEENPVSKLRKLKESKGRERLLSEEELDRLLEATKQSANKDLHTAVVLALSTGARKMEIWGLRWRDIDLNEGLATLHQTKNGETRTVPIQAYALELMRQRSKVRRIDTDLVFPSTIDPQKPFDFRTSWEKVLGEAEILDFCWHDLRHISGSYLAMGGASTREIAEILGHKTLQMAMRYSHLYQKHSASVVRTMNQKMFGDRRV